MSNDVSQEVFSDAPSEITIGGVEYEIHPIRQGNVWRVARWLKSSWMQDFLDDTRMVNLPSEDRAKAMSDISCTTPTFLEILNHVAANARLMGLQIKVNGKHLTMEYVLDEMKRSTHDTLHKILLDISTAKVEPENNTDPLDRRGTTSTITS